LSSTRIDMQDSVIRIKKQKPRNHTVEDLYDGPFPPKRETPKTQYQRKEKYNNWKFQTSDDDTDYDEE